MMNAELESQCAHFGHLAAELEQARDLFDGAGYCIVPDTSFYIEHPEKIEEANFHFLANSTGRVRIVVPIVVVDELDGLKKASASQVRWRAAYTLAVIDRLTVDPPLTGTLREQTTNPPRGAVTVQILFDSPGHRRMPINDDEIVERSIACEPYSGEITVVTYDTGQSTRARAAGLRVNKLSHKLGPEPVAT